MENTNVLQHLESVGFNGVLIILLFGIYKLLTSRNFVSKCGWMSLDFRSASTRQKELSNKHEIEMRKLEIDEIKAKAQLLKYESLVNKTVENGSPREEVTKGVKLTTDTGEGP